MKTLKGILKTCIPLIIALAAVLIISTALGNLSDGDRLEGKEQLEEALRRAALSCYASEGFFPPDVSYIEDNYGVQVDDKSYMVFYDVFAENLMPDIHVVVRSE